MKIELVLKICPWCRQTPDIHMPVHEETWVWYIHCHSDRCIMKPKTLHICIRGTTKTNFFAWHNKVEKLCHRWNYMNPMMANDMKVIDLQPLPELNAGAEFLCNVDPYFRRIHVL